MPNIKGTAILAFKDYINSNFGKEGWEKLLSKLTEEDREAVTTAVSISWVDMDVRLRLARIVDSTLGRGDGELLKTIAKYAAERDLSTAQRIFLRMASPAYTLEKASHYWRRLNDWGEFKVERSGKNRAIGTLYNSVVKDKMFCLQLSSYMAKALELVGAKGVKVTHTKCCARGDELCVYEGSWDK